MAVSQQSSNHPVIPEELSAGRLLAFALPALPVAAFQLPFVILVPKFYAENVGLSLFAVGAIIFIVRIIDAGLDPLVGYLADTTEVKWGRRRTWCALAAIPTTIGAFFVFNPFPNIPESNTFFWAAWFFVWSMMLSVGYTALSLSHLSWGAEVSLSYYGRNRIYAAREVLAVLGTLVATALPYVLSILGYHGDATVLIVLSLLVLVSLPIFIVILVTAVPEPPHVHQHHHHNFIDGLRGLRDNEPFKRLLGAYALANMGNAVPASLLLYFARDYIRAGEDTQRFFLLLYFLCGVLSTPLWLWVSRRTSKHRAWCYAMLVAVAGFIWTPLIGSNLLGAYSPYAFGVIMALAGMSVGADLMLPVSMQADVIDVDTARTGEQHTGFYFASWALANKIALSVALGFGFLLLWMAGFHKTIDDIKPPAAIEISAPAGSATPSVPTSPAVDLSPRHRAPAAASDEPVPQTPLALWTLVFLYCVVPILLKAAAMRLVWNFPIGANEQAKLREAIEAQLLADAETDTQTAAL